MTIIEPTKGVRTPPDPYYSGDDVTLYLGDSLAVLREMPDASVDCCVTSPPYFGLRDYGVNPTEWPEVVYAPMPGVPPVTVPAMTCPLGMEPNPNAFVAHLLTIFREVLRVLADDGTLWLNIGDSYATTPPGPRGNNSTLNGVKFLGSQIGGAPADVPMKSLIGIPWRLAFGLVSDGRLLRQEVIWSKRSCMPEAVKDRPSRSHEQVFLVTKGPRYWYDADAIREDSDPEQVAHNEKYAKVYAAQADRAAITGQPGNVNSAGIHSRPGKPGRNARSVWHISTQPFPGAHFAVMPRDVAERAVMAGCKPGGVVLDPFSGSGTTGAMATKHGRKYVGIDLSADYLDLSLSTRFAQPGLDLTGGVA
jgi:DNA modification methylase